MGGPTDVRNRNMASSVAQVSIGEHLCIWVPLQRRCHMVPLLPPAFCCLSFLSRQWSVVAGSVGKEPPKKYIPYWLLQSWRIVIPWPSRIKKPGWNHSRVRPMPVRTYEEIGGIYDMWAYVGIDWNIDILVAKMCLILLKSVNPSPLWPQTLLVYLWFGILMIYYIGSHGRVDEQRWVSCEIICTTAASRPSWKRCATPFLHANCGVRAKFSSAKLRERLARQTKFKTIVCGAPHSWGSWRSR